MRVVKAFGLRFTLAIMCLAVPLLHGCALLQKPVEPAAVSPGVTVEPSREEALPDRPSPSVTLPPAEKPPEPTKWPQTGEASWYGPRFHGKTTASGGTFNQQAFTAAHASLPFGSRVKVTNLANGKSVEVEINDRGPFEGKRIIDVSQAAAKALGMKESGTTTVRLEPLSNE